jgi:hypothetical protein
MKKILEWLGQDGLLHIVVCSILVGALNIVMPLWLAVVITAVVGVAKEFVYDKWLKKGTFEIKDLVCDLIGILIGCL